MYPFDHLRGLREASHLSLGEILEFTFGTVLLLVLGAAPAALLLWGLLSLVVGLIVRASGGEWSEVRSVLVGCGIFVGVLVALLYSYVLVCAAGERAVRNHKKAVKESGQEKLDV